MIVLTILGLAIGISYATANSSLQDIHQAEEHAQATELAQTQIEILRTFLGSGSPNIFIAGPFCMVPSGPSFAIWPQAPAIWPGGAYPSGCVYGTEPYTIKVNDLSVTDSSLPPDTFQVYIQWPNIRGEGSDSTTLTYQLHQTPS
jgi:type II secretory pathway pseudopilin PulG